MNGGTCVDPNVRCSCPDEWEGNQCETGKKFYYSHDTGHTCM